MKKKHIITFVAVLFVAVLLIPSITYWYLSKTSMISMKNTSHNISPPTLTIQESSSSAGTSSVASTSVTAAPIGVPISPYDDFMSTGQALSSAPSYMDPTGISHDTVSFKPVSDPAENPSYSLAVNETILGTVSGESISMASFSPDSSYFAFQIESSCGAGCNDLSLEIVNLKTHMLYEVPTPLTSRQYTGSTTLLQDHVATPLLASYSWDKNAADTLQITFFFIGADAVTGNLYRISPIQIWNYDLAATKYSLTS